MGFDTTREQRRELARLCAKLPAHLEPVSRDAWPERFSGARSLVVAVWRSREFLVQQFEAPAPAVARLSVCRTVVDGARWRDGITWDQLQGIKAQAGFGHCWAVEVYPPELEVVDVANIRHVWLLADAPGFAWRRGLVNGAPGPSP